MWFIVVASGSLAVALLVKLAILLPIDGWGHVRPPRRIEDE